jgi:hypothetical protein
MTAVHGVAASVAAIGVWVAPSAAADPGPFAPGATADCAGQVVPLDPRVSIQNPLGTLAFRAMLEAMCGSLAR